VTEWGWPTSTMSQQTQADWLGRSIELLNSTYKYVSIATYFVDYDRPPKYYQGLFTSSFAPKISTSTFRDAATSLRPPKLPKNLRLLDP
jgi:hypothetical protein